MPTHYETLGLPPSASPEEVRQAFRTAAKTFHPDVNSSREAAQKFRLAKEAYDTLTNPERKAAYDRILAERAAQSKAEAAANRIILDAEKREQFLREQAQKRRAEHTVRTLNEAEARALTQHLSELKTALAKGRLEQAARHAKDVLALDKTQALAYAALAEFALQQNNAPEAARQFAFAAQYAPREPRYQQMYERLMQEQTEGAAGPAEARLGFALPAAYAVTLSFACYLLLSNEPLLFPLTPGLNRLTLGHLMALIVSGISVGLAAGLTRALPPTSRLNSPTGQRLPAFSAYTLLTPLNFWFGIAVVSLLAARAKVFPVALLHLSGFTVSTAVLIALGSLARGGPEAALQILVWGTSLSSLTTLIGWGLNEPVRNALRR